MKGISKLNLDSQFQGRVSKSQERVYLLSTSSFGLFYKEICKLPWQDECLVPSPFLGFHGTAKVMGNWH